jgi:hypothetical protein
VWAYSTSKGGDLLVLLAIADYAHDNGVAFPSIKALGRKARLSESQVHRAVRNLRDKGEISVKQNAGKNGTNLYRVNLGEGGVILTGGVTGASQGVPPTAPEPSGTVSTEPPSEPLRERNPLWDVLVELFGDPATESARSLRGKTVRSFKKAGVEPEEIRARAKRWPMVMPVGATLTETALEKHWPLLAPKTRAVEPCEECGIGGGQHLAECSKVQASAK